MVKVNDPRSDRSAVAMRCLRADSANKCIKTIIKKSKVIDTNKINYKLSKLDNDFCEEFDNCSDMIKQELIFLWEEVGDLNKIIEEYESKESESESKESESNDKVKVNINCSKVPVPPVKEIQMPRKMRLFGP